MQNIKYHVSELCYICRWLICHLTVRRVNTATKETAAFRPVHTLTEPESRIYLKIFENTLLKEYSVNWSILIQFESISGDIDVDQINSKLN